MAYGLKASSCHPLICLTLKKKFVVQILDGEHTSYMQKTGLMPTFFFCFVFDFLFEMRRKTQSLCVNNKS